MVNRTIPPVLVRVVPAAHSLGGGGGEPGGGGGGRILSPLRERERERERGFVVVFLRLFPFLSLSFLFFFLLTTFLLFNKSSFLLHSRKTNTNERTNERTKVLEGTLIKLSLQIVRRRRAHATTAESVRGGVFVRVSRRVGRAQLLRAGFKHSEYDDDDGFYHQRRRRRRRKRRRRKRKVKKTTRLSRRQKRKSGEV